MSSKRHSPPRPRGIQVARWQRMCLHARNLLSLDHAIAAGRPSTVLAELHQAIVDQKEVSDWKQFPVALKAMREKVVAEDAFYRSLVEEPGQFLERLDNALRNRTRRLDIGHPEAWNRFYQGRFLGHARVQYAVGQGGFHVGGLTPLLSDATAIQDWAGRQHVGQSSFLYVYDCGSSPREGAAGEVKVFARRSRRKAVELLFLSHFDDDHMSSVSDLFSNKLKVDTVVMPYIDDVERVIGFARAVALKEAVAQLTAEMVVEPVRALRRLGVRQVLFVDGGDVTSPDADFGDPPSGSGGDGIKWRIAPKENGKLLHTRHLPDGAIVIRNAAIDVAASAGTGPAWRLVPYVRKARADEKALFAQVAEALLGWDYGTFAAQMADLGVRQSVIARSRDLLADAYKYAFRGKNITSLSLYSGPSDPRSAGATVVMPRMAEEEFAKIAWMGTGDAPLRRKSHIDAFEAHYGDLLDAVSTFMLPHHGSLHNSDPDRLISNADIYVAAAQPSREDWKHPAPQLEAKVRRLNRAFCRVDKRKGSRLEEAFVLFCTNLDEGDQDVA